MSDTGTIERFLVDRGLSLAGQVVASFDNDVLYFAFVKVIVGNDGRRIPNSFTLKKLSDEAAGIGYKISFVLVDGDRSDLDNSLKNMLFSKFPDNIRNSFAVFLRNMADVWVEPKRLLNENDEQSIHLAISQFLKFLEIEVKSIEITRSANVPTPTAILRAIRIIAPCSAHTLSEELVKRNFTVPNEVWMNHALDRLRKAGSVIRGRNGEYLLSLNGLNSLGTQKDRGSPDIVRALAFSKKAG